MITETLLAINTKPPVISTLFISIICIVFIISLFLNREKIINFVKKIKNKYWVILLLILLCSLFLRVYIAPHHHKMYMDEPMDLEQAKIMIEGGDYSQKTHTLSIGWPFILQWLFITFGINNWIAIYASSIIGALTIVNVFLFTYALLKNKQIAILSALIFTLIPIHILWSGSAKSHMAATFFASFNLFIWVLFSEKKDFSSQVLIFSSLAFSVMFRPENYVFIIPLLAYLLYKKRLLNKKTLFLLIIFIIIVLPNFSRVFVFQVLEHHSDAMSQNIYQEWKTGFLLKNTVNLIQNIFTNKIHPLLFSVFLIFGMLTILNNHKNKKVMFFLIANTVIIILWALPYYLYNNRFLILPYLFLSIYTSSGIYFISNKLSKIKIINKKLILKSFIIIIIILFVPYILKFNQPWVAHSLETKIPELAEKELPLNCFIITESPIILTSTTNLKTISIKYFLEENILKKKNETCFLFFDDIMCDGTFGLSESCKTIKQDYQLKEFKKYNFSYKNSFKEYIFYKIIDKKII